MMKHKPYPKYKPSGVDWIGNIPEGWEVIRSRYIFSSLSGNGFSVDLQGRGEGLYPFYKVSDINADATYVNESNNYVGSDNVMENRWTLIPKGSILFAKIGEALKKNHRKITLKDCLIDNNMMALYLKQSGRYDIKYLYYVLKIVDMVWFVNPGTIPSLDVNKWKNFYIPYIDFAIQQHIADFLDQKTAQIDDLIQKKEEMIKLLKEKRAAIINQAVTKGLDPNAQMKPSGIDWIGDIPEGWQVLRLKYKVLLDPSKNEVFKIISLDYDVTFLPMACVTEGGDINDENEKKLEDVFSGYTYFRDNDVVVAKITPCFENGKGALINGMKNGIGFGTTEFFVLRSKSLEEKYLFYLTKSDCFRRTGEASMKGAAGQKRIPDSFIKDFKIGFPEQKEQKRIANYLDKKTTEIDGLIHKIESAIVKLREYRSSLITAAVTGKIDVRGAVKC